MTISTIFFDAQMSYILLLYFILFFRGEKLWLDILTFRKMF